MTGISGPGGGDPFAVLGLSADDDLTDDDVRIAWRRIAAATHPDRADGGDPDRFALAAAAYTELRTGFGRNEARAGLTDSAPARAVTAARSWPGRPARLLLRLAVAAAAAVLGGTAAGWGTPAAPALVVGALTWLLVTGWAPASRRARGAWTDERSDEGRRRLKVPSPIVGPLMGFLRRAGNGGNDPARP